MPFDELRRQLISGVRNPSPTAGKVSEHKRRYLLRRTCRWPTYVGTLWWPVQRFRLELVHQTKPFTKLPSSIPMVMPQMVFLDWYLLKQNSTSWLSDLFLPLNHSLEIWQETWGDLLHARSGHIYAYTQTCMKSYLLRPRIEGRRLEIHVSSLKLKPWCPVLLKENVAKAEFKVESATSRITCDAWS